MRKTVLATVTTPVVPTPLTGAGTARAEVRTFAATAAPKDPDVPVGAQRVIGTAKSQTGKSHPHSRGAGGEDGASYGVHRHLDNDPAQGDDRILEASPPRDGKSIGISALDSHGMPCTKVRRIFG